VSDIGEEELSPIGPRIGALLIDQLLLGFATFVAIAAGVALADVNAALGASLLIAAVALTIFVVPALWAAGRWGSSPGKRAMDIAVIGVDGRPVSVGRGMVRQLVFIVGAIPFYIGWLAVLWDPKRQAWHDHAARTLVVKQEVVPEIVSHAASSAASTDFGEGPACPVCGFPLGEDGRCSVCGAKA
jgi:uncharacterized RDD family membrane protein YckC